MESRQSSGRIAERAANLVFIGGLGVCALGLLYIAYYYYWTGAREFTSDAIGWVFISILAVAGGLFAAGLKLRMPARGNAALSISSIAASIYAVEFFLSTWSSLPSVQDSEYRRTLAASARAAGVDFDVRTKAQVVRDLREKGLNPAVSIFPYGLVQPDDQGTLQSSIRIRGAELLPLAGISRRLTVVCNESGDFLTYQSDERGFHNPPGIWDQAPVDIVTLGDSFTQGWCVPSGRDFASVIRRHYPRTINLGIEGDGPLTMLATLKEYGRILKPRITLWCLFEGNDLADLQRETNTPLLRRYLTDGFTQGLATRQPEIDRELTTYMDAFIDANSTGLRMREVARLVLNVDDLPSRFVGVMKLSALRERLGLVANTERLAASPEAMAQRAQSMAGLFAAFRETLLEAKKLSDQAGGRLYVVYLPSRDTYLAQGPGPNPDRERLLEIVRAVGLPVIDIHPAFVNHGDPLGLFPFRYGAHYNEQGHALVAETILASVS
jgi:hypothetical protein